MCLFVISDRIAGHPVVAPKSSMSCLVIFSPLNSCFLKRQWRNWDRAHSSFWSVHCPSAVCQSPKFSNHAVDCFRVPSVLRFQSSEFAISEYTFCTPSQTFCTVAWHSKPNPELVSGIHSVHWICGQSLCQHSLAMSEKFLCRLLAMQTFKWRLPVHVLFDIWTGCVLHVPPTTAELAIHR